MAIKLTETEVIGAWTTAQVTVKVVRSNITNLPPISNPKPPISKIDFDWVFIPAGEFLMGSEKTKDPLAQDNEMPQHRLSLPDFLIAKLATIQKVCSRVYEGRTVKRKKTESVPPH